MQTALSRALRLSLVPFLFFSLWLAACAPGATPAPTRPPTRGARISAYIGKVARLVPTDTPQPTRTPRPTRNTVPTQTDAPTATNTPVKHNTKTPSVALAAAQGSQSSIPAATAPTAAPSATAVPNAALDVTGPCDATGGSQYGVLGAGGWEGRPPETHPDLNLAVRGYREVNAFRGLVDYDGQTDGDSPQLWGLFADRRTPEIGHTYQVYDWNWGANTRGDPIQDYDVTMAGFRTSPGETIFTPDFGREIGEGYVAIVLYADAHRATLKYTGEDNVVDGYTLHLEGICVYANLLALYNARQAAGRGALPALRPGQPVGYVPGNEFGVAIRDRGAFLDPRSRKDWWRGR